jgi:ribosomal protein S18 acetylase RimI-like enzyme
MVNTAADNRPALALYESFGFERQPGALLILERALR